MIVVMCFVGNVFTQLCLGTDHGCAIDNAGFLHCWCVNACVCVAFHELRLLLQGIKQRWTGVCVRGSLLHDIHLCRVPAQEEHSSLLHVARTSLALFVQT